MQKQLTVKEALEQGYVNFFYNSDGWQNMKYISDIGKEHYSVDWSRDDIYIVEKEAKQCISLSENELKEMILDQLECSHSDVTGSDDSYNTIQDAFSEFNWKPFEDAIEKILEGITAYRSTDIKLIP